MANKMLIDATHPEETRVVVLRGSRVEEFDFEAANKKQLRGNIYLAKVTRVEPSLQAAFVDYGGNRHGFLAFSEIHPDYYQIPVSDRQALLEADAQEEPEEEERRPPRRSRRHRRDRTASAEMHRDDAVLHEAASDGEVEMRPTVTPADATPPYDDATAAVIEHAEAVHEQLNQTPGQSEATEPAQTQDTSGPEAAVDVSPSKAATPEAAVAAAVAAGDEPATDAAVDTAGNAAPSDGAVEPHQDEFRGNEAQAASPEHGPDDDHHEDEEEDEEEDVSAHVEQLGGDAMEELPTRSHRMRRQYKIQEVIKRRQILLVQVVKEERGNKGAALTTYLSLAGRYSVLMPNTAKGGGISRKITDAGDRQRLKSIAQDLEVPEGMGVILRTAGAARSKPEVKRDFEYLMRMWETVRETTLGSQAPTLVYEEGSLIKRSIRDLYNKDVDEVIVAGEAGYREAKDFMRLLMPSHTRNVQLWRDPQPVFAKAGAEAQLDAMFSSHVTLRSGGYIVINQTEALVAIDVNSGRSTREHNIEDTALRTNLEAADEVARQLRLRDLAGLIVVDFIDMEENRNNRAVEKRIKDALKNDRARIQVGRISHFGLLEMSRQRIRTGVLEGSTVVCEHCAGAGMVRSTPSIALHVLRLLEDALVGDASHDLVVRTRSAVALYILNHKRRHIAELEMRFGVAVAFESDESLTGTDYSAIERGEPATGTPMPMRLVPAYEPDLGDDDAVDAENEGEETEAADASAPRDEDAEDDGPRRRRRRRRRGRDREPSGIAEDAPQPSDDALGFAGDGPTEGDAGGVAEASEAGNEASDGEAGHDEAGERRGRRRRSRRGRRPRDEASRSEDGGDAGDADTVNAAGDVATTDEDTGPAPSFDLPFSEAQRGANHDVPPRTEGAAAPAESGSVVELTPQPDPRADEGEPQPAQPELQAAGTEPSDEAAEASDTRTRRPAQTSSEADPSQPKRSGWWQRAKATLGG